MHTCMSLRWREAHSHTRVNKLCATQHRNGWWHLFMESIRRINERERERERERKKERKRERKTATTIVCREREIVIHICV